MAFNRRFVERRGVQAALAGGARPRRRTPPAGRCRRRRVRAHPRLGPAEEAPAGLSRTCGGAGDASGMCRTTPTAG